MGLDMEIQKITKPNIDASVIYDSDDFRDFRGKYSYLSAQIYKQYESRYSELAPYMQSVRAKNRYVDMEKIQNDFALSENLRTIPQIGDYITFADTSSDKKVKISIEEIKTKYIKEVIEDGFIFCEEEIRYWHEDYKKQDWFYDELGDVDNCKYCILSADNIKAFNETFGEDLPVEELNEESALFYLEWR